MSVMFKSWMLVKFMILASALILTDCAAKQTIKTEKVTSDKTGWINDETFVINGKGSPSAEIIDVNKRKEDSLRNAVSNAQKSAYDIFVTYYHEESGIGIQGYGNRKYEFMSYIRQIIATGRPVDIQYDSRQNCEILYEIKQERLKKKVTEFF